MSSTSDLLERAVACHRSGQLVAAAALYRKVLQSEPNQPDALHLLGLVAQHEGNLKQALHLYDAAIAANPKAAAFRLNRGIVLRQCGRTGDAVQDFHEAGNLEPESAEACHQEGNALKALGRFPEAIIALLKAAKLAPLDAAVRLNLGAAHLEASQLGDAIHAFREALRLEPGRAEAHNILGHTLALTGNFTAAEAEYKAALKLDPNHAAAHDNLGGLLKAQARIPEALDHYRASLAINRSAATHSNLLLALNFSTTAPSEIYLEHIKWEEAHGTAFRPTWPAHLSRRPDPNHRLRIGYVSPDFVNHAVAHFIEPVLQHHDRFQFEVFCYSDAKIPDAVTARVEKTTEHWRDISRINDEQVAALIRSDDIDLLVDLAGHTAGNRLQVFARKPAQLQVTWIGYPNTTGLSAIDYRITDAIADPIGKTDAWHSERLLRLPESFSCYLPSPESPPVSELPAQKTGHVTFGSFNQFPKLGPPVIELWARVLREIPTARLLLRARSLADEASSARLRKTFSSLGITADRLDFDGRKLSVAAHQGAYQKVDIGLDPFPYNGTTTTCEALWNGVPVVALAGDTHVSRVGASLLTQIQATDWIAANADEYVQRCVTLASDLADLAAIRAGLRQRLLSSPLGDAPRFTRHLESTYLAVWNEYCRSHP